MRGHHPLGWAATLLIAVAYAHVLLELAAAVLAVAVAGCSSPPPATWCERAIAHSSAGVGGRWRW